MDALRVLHDNLSTRGQLTASTSHNSFPVGNLRQLRKSKLWRSTGKTGTLTLTLPTAFIVGVVALVNVNFTPAATMRVRVGDYDSGARLCCPQGVKSGHVRYAWAWIPRTAGATVTIDIADPGNPAAIQAGVLVVGDYWEPESTNAEYDAAVGFHDTGKQPRTKAGDILPDPGVRYRSVSFSMKALSEPDRSQLTALVGNSGATSPVLFSLFPEDDDPTKEAEYMLYGYLPPESRLVYAALGSYNTQLSLQEA